jgi:hypothetical protein
MFVDDDTLSEKNTVYVEASTAADLCDDNNLHCRSPKREAGDLLGVFFNVDYLLDLV